MGFSSITSEASYSFKINDDNYANKIQKETKMQLSWMVGVGANVKLSEDGATKFDLGYEYQYFGKSPEVKGPIGVDLQLKPKTYSGHAVTAKIKFDI